MIEETRLGASNYLLVADSDDEDAECLILKDTSRDEDPEAVYELVEDETELDAVSKVFEDSFLMRILPLSDAQKM